MPRSAHFFPVVAHIFPQMYYYSFYMNVKIVSSFVVVIFLLLFLFLPFLLAPEYFIAFLKDCVIFLCTLDLLTIIFLFFVYVFFPTHFIFYPLRVKLPYYTITIYTLVNCFKFCYVNTIVHMIKDVDFIVTTLCLLLSCV